VTCSGARHSVQRRNRVRLKADAVILLDRIATVGAYGLPISEGLMLQIAEMRLRLAPPPGVKAPIIRTGYTK
jgi:hypothetical protein